MAKRTTVGLVRVSVSPQDPRRGRLTAGGIAIPCALGRAGVVRVKREGDGGTPVGRFSPLGVFYRPDRVARPRARVPVRPHHPNDGWCDDPRDRRYNRPVRLPCEVSCERMWREDRLYDVVIDLAYNRGPIRPGRGSAIFLHLARDDGGPTEGCIAVPPGAMRRLLPLIGPSTRIVVTR